MRGAFEQSHRGTEPQRGFDDARRLCASVPLWLCFLTAEVTE